MKKILTICLSSLLSLNVISQNIGINGSGAVPHPSALLDIDAASTPSLGILIPRIALQAINISSPVTSPATSLLVYNTATASSGITAVSPGYYYWDGTQSVRFAYSPSGSSANDWNLLGNSGTVSSTNFIGTTDNIDFVFRTNNIERMRVLNNGFVGIGITNPNQRLEVNNTVGIRSSNPFLYFNSTFTTIPADATIGIRSAGEMVLRSNATNTLLADWEVKYGYGTSINPNDCFYIGRRAVSSGTMSNYFYINSLGNVGISNTTPNTQLDVAGLGQIWIRKALGGGLPVAAGEGFKIESGPNGGLLQAYDYATTTPKNILMQTVGGNVGINTIAPNGLLANNNTNFGALSNGCNNFSLNWTNASTGNGWVGTFSSNGPHGLLASTTGTTASDVPLAVTSGTFNTILGTRQNDNLLIVRGNGNVGLGTSVPAFKLHVENGQIAQITTTNTSHSIFMGNSSGRNWQLYHLGSLDVNAPNGFMFEHFDGSVWQRRMTIDQTGNVGIGALSPSTKLHVVSTTSNTAFRMQDGTEGTGKVLTSDANGNATWQSPSALANYPFQSILDLPVGANCPVGGSYATPSITLPAGIYYYTNYSCDGQIGASTPAGFNVDIQIVSGSGDSNGTFHDFNIGFGGSCGNYFTGIVRCFTPCTVRRVYTSYGGSSFTVPGANSESTLFIKIL